MTQPFFVRERSISSGAKTWIVAELSANHRHNLDQAIALVRAAHEAGADAIKLQTYTADTITFPSSSEIFRIGGGSLWDGRTLYDLYEEAYTPWEWHPQLQDEAHRLGMEFFFDGI